MQIIGAGRVGQALAARAEAQGVPCLLVDRHQGWDAVAEGEGPILVATRNDDLDTVVKKVPTPRRPDLVFVQNGMLRPWLQRRRLVTNTRGLLFFAVPSRGAPLQPGPPSPFAGHHAQAVVEFLQGIDVPASAVPWYRFAAQEVEKLIWNTAFGVMCQGWDAPVGVIATDHLGELTALVDELHGLCRYDLGVELEIGPLMDRLCSYSLTIPDYQGAVKEWRWRNGWFVELARHIGRPTPVHDNALERAGVGPGGL